MNEQTITDIILEDRGKFYGCSRETFFRKGTTLKQRDSQNGENSLYVSRIFDHHFITTGKEIFDKLNALPNFDKEELSTEKLKGILNDFTIEETYPHFFYRESSISIPDLAPGYTIRAADPDDHPPLQKFLDGCTEEDIEDALIELDDPDEEIRLIYFEGQPVGYAGYRRWGKSMGDVGILIQKEHRKKGLGRAAVAVATESCLRNDCLPFYRTNTDNIGSETIARSLGYTFQWITAECYCKL